MSVCRGGHTDCARLWQGQWAAEPFPFDLYVAFFSVSLARSLLVVELADRVLLVIASSNGCWGDRM